MLLTIQRFDGAVDLSVIVVCEVAMINGTKVTWRKERQEQKNPNTAFLFRIFFTVTGERDSSASPFPMMRWCCTRSICAGMRTSFTSSSSCGRKLEIEIFSAGMSGVSVGSMVPAAKAKLGNTGPANGLGGFSDATDESPAR